MALIMVIIRCLSVLLAVCFSANGSVVRLETFVRDLATQSAATEGAPHEKAVSESVNVVLRLGDSNRDGVIGLDELETVLQRYINRIAGEGETAFSTWKEYAMAVAGVLDTNQSGALERGELERLVTSFLGRTGDVQAAYLIESELSLALTLGDVGLPRGRRLMNIAYVAMDTDNDEVITMEEARRYYSHNRLSYFWPDAKVLAQDVDENGDNKLTKREVFGWLRLLRFESEWDIRRMFIYSKLKQRLGEELADQWLDEM